MLTDTKVLRIHCRKREKRKSHRMWLFLFRMPNT